MWNLASETVKQCLFFLEMYNKTIIEFGFCDMRNYQGLGECYLITLTSTLIIPHITKTSSNNCLLLYSQLLDMSFSAI